MTAAPPFFSVVMATWGRGRHILPSIRSVLQQRFADLELIVVGDATTDETETVVKAVSDPRLRWLNLPERCGGQSAPNNAGIAAARAPLIAYLGHDDLWEPDHLERLAALYRSDDPPDFVVSGSILHLPNGLPGSAVHGLFEDDQDVSRFFFPPSSFSHTKAAIDRIGPWRMPMEVKAPVDDDLLRRATAAGLRFRSTGVVTVQKFAAGHRYLSYVRQDSDEQDAMLAAMAAPDHKDRIARIVEDARARGTYMGVARKDFDRLAPGELARRNMQRKGLQNVTLLPLGRGATVQHRKELGVFDWEDQPRRGFRVTKANPRPRLLIPLTGGRARLSFLVTQPGVRGIGPLEMRCNGKTLVARPGWAWFGRPARYRVEIDLLPDAPTLLELVLSETQRPRANRPGIAVGPLHLSPI